MNRRFLTCLTALALAAGCSGPPLGTVSGTVMLDGAPVSGGTISFLPAAGAGVTVAIGPDGAYRAENVPVGDVAVSVAAPPADVDPKVRKGLKAAPPRSTWPERYANPATSGWTCPVKAGPNTFDATMTTK